MQLRTYAPSDRAAVGRIWLEVGWIEDEPHFQKAVDQFLEGCSSWVAEIGGDAECLVSTAPGTMRYLDEDLRLSIVAAVTTSRVARRIGVASRLLARAMADDVQRGAEIGALGMFEQGFYDRHGFGTGPLETEVWFDPASLRVPFSRRPPVRLGVEDAEEVHACRMAGLRGHGACTLTPPQLTKADILYWENSFGLGFRDGPAGELTHMVFASAKDVEYGPYRVMWLAYRTGAQLLELLGLLHNLSDQVRMVGLLQPPALQLQDLLDAPIRNEDLSADLGRHRQGQRSLAYWQARIYDVAACLAKTKLPGVDVRFNLHLTDPIGRFLEPDAPWTGCGGRYVVELGATSGAEPGEDPSLPTLAASVGAFTRLWLGVAPATGLALTDDLRGPAELLDALDWALRLPTPRVDWDF